MTQPFVQCLETKQLSCSKLNRLRARQRRNERSNRAQHLVSPVGSEREDVQLFKSILGAPSAGETENGDGEGQMAVSKLQSFSALTEFGSINR